MWSKWNDHFTDHMRYGQTFIVISIAPVSIPNLSRAAPLINDVSRLVAIEARALGEYYLVYDASDRVLHSRSTYSLYKYQNIGNQFQVTN
jgi:hypothetical protein